MSIGAPNRAGRLYRRFNKESMRFTEATNPTQSSFMKRKGNPTNKKRGNGMDNAQPYMASMNYFNYFRGLRNGG